MATWGRLQSKSNLLRPCIQMPNFTVSMKMFAAWYKKQFLKTVYLSVTEFHRFSHF